MAKILTIGFWKKIFDHDHDTWTWAKWSKNRGGHNHHHHSRFTILEKNFSKDTFQDMHRSMTIKI